MILHDSNFAENKEHMSLDIVAHRQHRFYKKTNAYANNVSSQELQLEYLERLITLFGG